MPAQQPLEVEPAALVRAAMKGWMLVLAGAALGALAAVAIVVFVPPTFEGRALVLIKTPQDASSMLKSRLGPLSELAPSALGLGSGKEDVATELALFQSRSVLGRVVDSLRLQFRPVEPNRVPPSGEVDSLRLDGRFKPRKVTLHAGKNEFPEGQVFVSSKISGDIRARLFDREDAIDDLADALDVRTQGGDAVRVRYRGFDSLTAAAVPNLATDIYLARRHTTDRGLNQRRFEFLLAKADSVGGDLRRAARDLRQTQDVQNLFDAEPAAKSLFERLAALETQRAEVHAEEITLDSVLARAGRPGFDPRLVAGVPSLLKSPAVNDLVSQIAKTDAQRGSLLAQYSDSAPGVLALARVSDSLRVQLVPLARTFGESLHRQRVSLEGEIAAASASLSALPGQSETVALREAAVKRIVTLDIGMGAQLLDARLAALTEVGDVRLVDAAVAPRKVAFPRPAWTFAICILLGITLGLSIVFLGAASERPAEA
jgi:uncharacterized protein involved in exopolysaccharide biosynthesis